MFDFYLLGIFYDVIGEFFIEMLEFGFLEMGKVYVYRYGDCVAFDLSVVFLINIGD